MKLLGWAAAAVFVWMTAACTKVNPERCCINAEDCARFGIEGDTLPCPAGQACVANECVVASCSTQGCAVEAPVCNIESDVCEGCTVEADCARFPDQNVCEPTSGHCVECVSPADCGAAAPICDANECRGCKADSECASGACGDDGACIADAAVVYMDPTGSDSGDCTKAAPCRTLLFAAGRTTNARSHIVMRKAAYVVNEAFVIDAQVTSALKLFIHGHESTLSASAGDDTMVRLIVPVAVQDLDFESQLGSALDLFPIGGTSSVERSRIRATTRAVNASGMVTLRDVTLEGSGSLIGLTVGSGASLTIDRAVISGFDRCIDGNGQDPTLNVNNLLVYGCRSLAIDLPFARGSIAFSTIANSGPDTGTGPRAVVCGQQLTVSSSIIWAPGATARPAIAGCSLVNTIVGPTPVAGASSSDPMFVDSAAGDFHLKPGSPARELVDAGPSFDYERTPRPQGTRFDIGADEAMP